MLNDRDLVLRPLEERDLEPLLGVVTAPGVAEWWGPIADREREAEGLRNSASGGAFAIEVAGELAGWLGYDEVLEPAYRYASIDIVLAPSFQDRGHGRRALRLAIGWLTAERGHHRITIDPLVENGRAVHVYELVGFRPVGVLRRYQRLHDGEWHDGLLMELVLEI